CREMDSLSSLPADVLHLILLETALCSPCTLPRLAQANKAVYSAYRHFERPLLRAALLVTVEFDEEIFEKAVRLARSELALVDAQAARALAEDDKAQPDSGARQQEDIVGSSTDDKSVEDAEHANQQLP